MKAALEDLEGELAALEARLTGPGPQLKEVKDKAKRERTQGTLIISEKGLTHVIPTGSQKGCKGVVEDPLRMALREAGLVRGGRWL